MTKDEQLTIREVAEKTGLSAHTLRYYERIGLMAPVHKGLRGHRRYDKGDLEWLVLIKRLRSTGMPVAEMQRFAELVRQGEATISERRKLLETQQQVLQARLEDIGATLELLEHKVTTYRAVEAARKPVKETV